jgi:hypothetical protein
MKRIEPRSNWPQDAIYIQLNKKHPMFYAYADEERERIFLSKGWEKDEDIDAYVFHEYRHILHKREGLFKDYYARLKDVKHRIKLDPNGWLSFALSAETDCDKYALEKTGVNLGEYPVYAVAHYSLAMSLIKKLKK